MVLVPAFYNKLVTSVHFQSFAIVTDTSFSIHRCQLYCSTLAILSTLLIQLSHPLYFPFLSIQVRRHLFLSSSSHYPRRFPAQSVCPSLSIHNSLQNPPSALHLQLLGDDQEIDESSRGPLGTGDIILLMLNVLRAYI
ncbi:hypothetical protein BDR04DRAFT_1104656 [Suillus decipiens]|nr:hypothetical protein BDR04DRAFT_1104656 [Suillus decipiens]